MSKEQDKQMLGGSHNDYSDDEDERLDIDDDISLRKSGAEKMDGTFS